MSSSWREHARMDRDNPYISRSQREQEMSEANQRASEILNSETAQNIAKAGAGQAAGWGLGEWLKLWGNNN